jgi:hypothetical protein
VVEGKLRKCRNSPGRNAFENQNRRRNAMITAFEVATVLVVAVVMAQSLAHALEYPGKMRLSKEQYLTVQPIYYPGFTIGGVSEPLAILLLAALPFTQPAGIPFWLTLGALLALAASHASYWLLTHPVNNFWLRETELEGAGKRFFGSDPLKRGQARDNADWTVLRDRWEGSHLLRALLSFISLALLAAAVAS